MLPGMSASPQPSPATLSVVATIAAAPFIGVSVLSLLPPIGLAGIHALWVYCAACSATLLVLAAAFRKRRSWAPTAAILTTLPLLLVTVLNDLTFRWVFGVGLGLLCILSFTAAIMRGHGPVQAFSGPKREPLRFAWFGLILIALSSAPLWGRHHGLAGAIHCHTFWTGPHVH